MPIKQLNVKIINKLSLICKIFFLYVLKICNIYSSNHSFNICLVRLDAIGDFILWLQTAKYYRKIYANRKITLICNDAYLDLAESINIFDQVIGLNISRFCKFDLTYWWNLSRKINQLQYEIVICDMYSRVFETSDLVVYLTNAKLKIGRTGDLSNISNNKRQISNSWYDQLINDANEKIFEINRNLYFVKQLLPGLRFTFSDIQSLINNDDTAVQQNNNFGQYIVINLAASHSGRMWGAVNFTLLINSINPLFNVILLGGKAENGLYEEIKDLLTRPVSNYIGHTSLKEAIKIIANAKLVIGNETSTIHIAAAVNTPSICILGGGHFGRFMPYDIDQEWSWPIAVYHEMECFNCNWKCIYPLQNGTTWRCIASIEVNKVINLTNELLSK